MMPELTNCPHSPDGWCLACVGELHSQWDAMKTVADAAADTANKEAMALVAFRQAVADALDALRDAVMAEIRDGRPVDFIAEDVVGYFDATIAKLGLDVAKEQANVSA